MTEDRNGPAGPGLILAAPASGSGKTVLTLALLRHLRNRGLAVASAKVGPDYIDPAFHAAASGRPCVNLDPWAMRPACLTALASGQASGADILLVEGVMGLFDGAADGSGATADLAAATGWPVVLVVDVRGQAGSVAALVHGFHTFRPDVPLAGVICNRVGGPGHADQLRRALAPVGVPLLGCVTRAGQLDLPDRHLGLVPAAEHPKLQAFLEAAAAVVAEGIDIAALLKTALRASVPDKAECVAVGPPVSPLGQRIAVARDLAFVFAYPHLLDGWRAAGSEILPFSPLGDQGPDAAADAVFLPGGYPELHPGRLATAERFRAGLRGAAERGVPVYGECGGYMVLGTGLTDARGERHRMAGLLPVETSFAERRLHLGYRKLTLRSDSPLGVKGGGFRAHEFHYASILSEDTSRRLFDCHDARGDPIPAAGCLRGSVFGSFLHLIDRAAD